MLYTVELNRKKYIVDVKENVVKIKKQNIDLEKSENDDFLNEELPDFNFSETKSCSRINSQISGRMIGINVSVGQMVKNNQVLAVIESMKMEINIVSRGDGIIQEIKVNNGDFVKLNQELFAIKQLD